MVKCDGFESMLNYFMLMKQAQEYIFEDELKEIRGYLMLNQDRLDREDVVVLMYTRNFLKISIASDCEFIEMNFGEELENSCHNLCCFILNVPAYAVI